MYCGVDTMKMVPGNVSLVTGTTASVDIGRLVLPKTWESLALLRLEPMRLAMGRFVRRIRVFTFRSNLSSKPVNSNLFFSSFGARFGVK